VKSIRGFVPTFMEKPVVQAKLMGTKNSPSTRFCGKQ
jgi:hypothetical protein